MGDDPIKDGIIYDAKKLVAGMRKLVQEANDGEKMEISHPGVVTAPQEKSR